jgi:hypothetical protein
VYPAERFEPDAVCRVQKLQQQLSSARRAAIKSLAEAPLDPVLGRVRTLLDAFAEAPSGPALFGSALDTFAEAPDAALARWARPATDALIEPVFDLLRRGGMLGFCRFRLNTDPAVPGEK